MNFCAKRKIALDPRELVKRDTPLPPLSDIMVLIVHNDVSESDDPSEMDVMDEAQAVIDSLKPLGISFHMIPISDPRTFGEKLNAAPRGKSGTVVWNLFEYLTGTWYSQTILESALPTVAESLGFGAVGADALALWLTTNKSLTRSVLAEAGLPVAPGANFPVGTAEEKFLERMRSLFTDESNRDVLNCEVIVKPTSSDGSEGVEWKKSVFYKGDDLRKVWARVTELHETMNMGGLVEKLVGDSEFNISVAEDPELRVAAIADIDFSPLPEGLPPIVDYGSKWLPEDPMYLSKRRLPSDIDEESVALIKDISLRAFKATGMRDFGRVDIRCNMKDRHIDPNNIWILELNANPCISPGSGFYDGLQAMGTPFEVFAKSMIVVSYKRSLDYARWLEAQEKKE